MSKFDKNTTYAVKCILLGARIHDASALCDKTDQAMRLSLFKFCQSANPSVFEDISIEAAHLGYATIPAQMLRDKSLDFLGDIDNTFIVEFLTDKVDELSDVKSYFLKCLENANKRLSIWRARHDSWEGFRKLTEESSY
ncbi:hypothetical protein MOS07_004287 [Vibrio vulnificus]|nr:hypothetical protein [Vibrio vulnificus]